MNENDIVEWCQTVEIDILGDIDGMYRYIGLELPVTHGRALIPCNTFRILAVYTQQNNPLSTISFHRLPRHLSFGSATGLSSVYMDYVGLPIDLETGIPLIQVGHEEACAAYCIYMMHYEEGINGRMPGFQMLKADMQHEILAAAGSVNMRRKTLKTVDDLEAIRFNMSPAPATLALTTGNFANAR